MSERIEAEIVVVGAGPAGAATAARLGQLGLPGVVLVDRRDSPREKTCGSGVSPKGIAALKELGVWTDVERLGYRITGLRLVAPSGREAVLSGGPAVEAIVCRRSVLDDLLVRRAIAGGARFIPRFHVASLLEEGGRARGVVARDGRQIRARYTVIAGGSHCGLARDRRPRKVLQAIMGWWEGVPFHPHHLEMVFDPMLVPLYGWLFPESDGLVNIGITYEDSGGKRNARELFARFLERWYAGRLAGARAVGAWQGHPIVTSYRIGRLTSPGCIVVGESGLLTHPATAEGIYHAMRSGISAAESLRDILVGAMGESRAMAAHERRCRREFQGSFYRAALFRGLLRTPAFDWIVSLADRPAVRRTATRLFAPSE